MLKSVLRPACLLAFALLAAPAAHAGDLSLGLVVGGEHGRVELSYGNRGCGYGYGRPAVVRGCALHRSCYPTRVFVPAHYATVERRVWVPPAREKVWVDAVYETRYGHCGRPYRVLVCAGRWTVRVLPGHYETRCEQVFIPGAYETRCTG